jgi:prefoldin alpha subunit
MSNQTQPGMISPEEFQRMVYLYQMLEEQQQLLSEQQQMIQQQIMGANLSKASIEGLKGVSVDHELVIPLGSYAYTKVKIIDPSKIMVSVGKEIIIEKTLDDAIKSMTDLLANYNSVHDKLVSQLRDIESKMAQLKPQIDSIYEAAQNARQ